MCWGHNNVGQTNVPAIASSNQVAVSAGYYHACSLSIAGAVTCWGQNGFGGTYSVPETASFGVALPCRRASLIFPTPTATSSSSQTATPTSTLTSGLSCPPSLFRGLPRTDLVGAPLSDAPLAVASEGACRIACCGAPACDGYAFAFTELRFGDASCFLFSGITETTAVNVMASGLRVGVTLPGSPASVSPAGTPLPVRGWPQAGLSMTPTSTSTPATPLPVMSPGQIETLVPSLSNIRCLCNQDVSGVGSRYSEAGDGGPASAASFCCISSIAVDQQGKIFVADFRYHRVRAISTTGLIELIAGRGDFDYFRFDQQFNGDGMVSTMALIVPLAIAHNPEGKLIIQDTSTLRVVDLDTGVIQALFNASHPGQILLSESNPDIPWLNFNNFAIDRTGRILTRSLLRAQSVIRINLDGHTEVLAFAESSSTSSGDGGLATNASLSGEGESKMATTPSGEIIFVSDGARIRRIDVGSNSIRTIAGNGIIGFSGDGGPGTLAMISWDVQAMVADEQSNLFFAEANRIRIVNSSSGFISTIAGNSSSIFSGDGGPASLATFEQITAMAIDNEGSLLIGDSSRLRKIFRVASPRIVSPALTCSPSLFRSLPRIDLVGTLVGTAMEPGVRVLLVSEAACRQACCDAPACDGFSFAASELRPWSPQASCFLLVNITQLIPSSGYSSGIYESTL